MGLKPVSCWHCFEPTLQSSTMICTIHGFTAGVFTPPSGEQGRLRRTNNQDEHTLAGSQFCLVAFGSFVQSFKGPSKKLKPVKPSAALQEGTLPCRILRYATKENHRLPAVPIDPTAAGLITVIPRPTPETPFTAGTIVITIPTPGGIRATGACSL